MNHPSLVPVFVVGNWKMTGSRGEVATFFSTLSKAFQSQSQNQFQNPNQVQNQKSFDADPIPVQGILCPPFPYLSQSLNALEDPFLKPFLKLGGQNCSVRAGGAMTGDVSAPMLQDSGCSYVILGHSERRIYFHETSDMVAQKVVLAQQNALVPIVCIGETLQEKQSGKTFEVLKEQLKTSLPLEAFENQGNPDLIIAYEPVWAIGTGLTPLPQEVNALHRALQEFVESFLGLAQIPFLYGGSVNAQNMKGFIQCPCIQGVLVGGASVDPLEFFQMLHMAFSHGSQSRHTRS